MTNGIITKMLKYQPLPTPPLTSPLNKGEGMREPWFPPL